MLVLAAIAYLPLTLLAPLGSATTQTVPFTAPENPAVELAWPGYGASAVGAIGFPGVLAVGGEETPRSIASISKVVTALVVLEAKPLAVDEQGPEITMTEADTALWHKYFIQDGSIEPVRTGLVLTQRELMDAVLISSANNYAESLALWAYGSMPEFLTATRTWLDSHGLANTTILEPTGIDPGNKSTASELVELGKIALDNPTIAAIVSTESVSLPYMGTIENTNALLGSEGVNGIKTGTLDESGSCLLFAASITVAGHEIQVVGVVLGAENRSTLNGSVQALLASAVNGFRELPLVTAGTVVANYSTSWDQSANAVVAKDESVLVWAGAPVEQKVKVGEVRTGGAGENVGSLVFTVDGKKITVPVILDSAIADPGPWWRLTHPFG